MVNYYEELGLDRALDTEAIGRELSRQESVWKGRITQKPEKAMRMLVLIDDARTVFAADSSRKEYDEALDAPETPIEEGSPEQKRLEEWEKWYEQAEKHGDRKDWDLAKTAFKKALTFYSDSVPNKSIFWLCGGQIYANLGDYRQSMECCNKAIVENPDSLQPYMERAIWQTRAACFSDMDRDKYWRDAERSISMVLSSLGKIDAANAPVAAALASQIEANGFSVEAAERIAQRAKECGDSRYAPVVLDKIESARRATAERAEAERKAAEQAEANRKAQEKREETWRNRQKIGLWIGRAGMITCLLVVAFYVYSLYLLVVGTSVSNATLTSIAWALYIGAALEYGGRTYTSTCTYETSFAAALPGLGALFLFVFTGTFTYEANGHSSASAGMAWQAGGTAVLGVVIAMIIGYVIGRAMRSAHWKERNVS